MVAKANREWQDLPKRLNCFTVRNATMIDLDTKEIIRHYSANTKIAVVQRCVTPEGTYYRTAESALHGLDHAFNGTAFGLPDEKAEPKGEGGTLKKIFNKLLRRRNG